MRINPLFRALIMRINPLFRALIFTVVTVIFCSCPVALAQELESPFRDSRHPAMTFRAPTTLPGVLIAAPHGGFDINTPSMASFVADYCGAGLLTATGWRVTSQQRFINVNRPTSAPFKDGKRLAREVESPEAEAVFAAWRALMPPAAGVTSFPIPLYIEIHGHSRRGPSGKILDVVEAATVDLSPQTCLMIREKLLHFLRMAGVRPIPVFFHTRDDFYRVPWEKARIPFRWKAYGARTQGSLTRDRVCKAIHFEFPPSVRKSETQRRAWATALGQLTLWLSDILR